MKSPIIFSAPMIQALLDGRKTQTRRVIKPQPSGAYMGCPYEMHRFELRDSESAWQSIRCPFGKAGDLLWVRETFHIHGDGSITFRADSDPCSDSETFCASRITLKIADVRVERVRDISQAEANAEGIERLWENRLGAKFCTNNTRHDFSLLWDLINEKRGYSWKSNPWVWVLEFEVIKQNVDSI